MKKYLTISEFARLRNVNINSIRYYEKLKLLTPAWVDPVTKYRYYLPEQINVLDTITLFIRLGIPLKDLGKYVDENGNLNRKEIFQNSQKVMREKIYNMQLDLEFIQFNLNTMKENQQYNDKKKYTREIKERFFIIKPFMGNIENTALMEKEAMSLFYYAQERRMSPVFPSGILIHYKTKPTSFSLFFQILHPIAQDHHIIHVPKSTFSCMQADLTSNTNILELLNEKFLIDNNKTIIISNMVMNKFCFSSRHSEIQVPSDYK